jgi:hypothetical protein
MDNEELFEDDPEFLHHLHAMLERADRDRERQLKLKEWRESAITFMDKPVIGESFQFDDEKWLIEGYLPFPTRTKAIYNQGLLFIRALKNRRLYTLPHRIDGSLERRTVSRFPNELIPYFRRSTPEPLNVTFAEDLPQDVTFPLCYVPFQEQTQIMRGERKMFAISRGEDYHQYKNTAAYKAEAKVFEQICNWATALVGGTKPKGLRSWRFQKPNLNLEDTEDSTVVAWWHAEFDIRLLTTQGGSNTS